ncbi:Allantoate permease [Hypoxylon texense]
MADKEITIVRAGRVAVSCSWTASQNIKSGSCDNTVSQVVDLFFTAKYSSPGHGNLQVQADDAVWFMDSNGEPQPVKGEAFGSQEAFQFLLTCLRATESTKNRIARLIIPLQKGTIVRSDIVSLRLKDAFAVDEVVSFSTPLQSFAGAPLRMDAASLLELFRASAGGILLQHVATGGELVTAKPSVPPAFEADFEEKMSLPWITPGPPAAARQRLVVVGCSAREPSSGGWMAYVFGAARALGIDLVLVEKPGGWFERPEFASSYEALLPADPSWWSNPPGDDVADRLVGLVRAYGRRVDGIVAFLEPFLATVSRAARELGLPCQPAESYAVATDKYRLGVSEGRQAFCGSTAEEALAFARDRNLAYPLILKPRLGLNSEGVVRVDDVTGIRPAVELIQKTFFKSFTMERYCEGPEVDVNVVLLDGEILFCEIADDFPKPGDCGGGDGVTNSKGTSAAQRNFLETYIVYPSALPSAELTMLRDSISATIRRLGFSSGIMHVEARVDRSSVEYRRPARGGIPDLAPRGSGGGGGKAEAEAEAAVASASASASEQQQQQQQQPPAPWVLEINPRPPGLTASRIIESVYGIDYFGVALALALDDKPRARALARPFRGGGAQHTGVMALVRADYDEDACEGVFDSDDICEELLARRPDLARHVNRYGCLAKRGQKIPHPSSGANTFIAYFNVFSKSRREALEIAAEVKKEVRYSFR